MLPYGKNKASSSSAPAAPPRKKMKLPSAASPISKGKIPGHLRCTDCGGSCKAGDGKGWAVSKYKNLDEVARLTELHATWVGQDKLGQPEVKATCCPAWLRRIPRSQCGREKC